MEDLVLSIEDLTIGFNYQGRPFNAVENANIELHAGCSLGIVGESGSGKSLTARSILNLLPQNAILKSGHIRLKEKYGGFINVLEAPTSVLERLRGDSVSMIFQEPMTSLNPVYRCGNQVTENIRKHTKSDAKEAKAKAINLFEEVKLPTPERIFKSYPHELSGGQRQRVMIAMALSCQPKILIADEPTTALDVTVQKSILDLLKSLQKKYSMSLIFISHDLGVISEVADNVAVMYQGRIVEQGLLSQIIDNLDYSLDAAINIEVSDEEVVTRLSGRRICSDCGATYHLDFNSPQQEGSCDQCGGQLYQRDDDTPGTIKERLEVYYDQTKEVVDYYKKLDLVLTIDGEADLDDVFTSIQDGLEQIS